MSYGLSGAHRTGKTTLAQAYAQRENIPFVRTSATEVFNILGKDPKADYPIDERIAIQEALLYSFTRQFEHAAGQSERWISDRTPIDLASYLLADVNRSTFSAEQYELSEYVNGYVTRCIEATNKWFSVVIMVQPGIRTVEEAGKAPADPAYMEHLNFLQKGLITSEVLKTKAYVIPRVFTDMSDRLECVDNSVRHCMATAEFQHQKRMEMGLALH